MYAIRRHQADIASGITLKHFLLIRDLLKQAHSSIPTVHRDPRVAPYKYNRHFVPHGTTATNTDRCDLWLDIHSWWLEMPTL